MELLRVVKRVEKFNFSCVSLSVQPYHTVALQFPLTPNFIFRQSGIVKCPQGTHNGIELEATDTKANQQTQKLYSNILPSTKLYADVTYNGFRPQLHYTGLLSERSDFHIG